MREGGAASAPLLLLPLPLLLPPPLLLTSLGSACSMSIRSVACPPWPAAPALARGCGTARGRARLPPAWCRRHRCQRGPWRPSVCVAGGDTGMHAGELCGAVQCVRVVHCMASMSAGGRGVASPAIQATSSTQETPKLSLRQQRDERGVPRQTRADLHREVKRDSLP